MMNSTKNPVPLKHTKKEEDGHKPCLFTCEEYEKITEALREKEDGRYEKQTMGKKRNTSSGINIEKILSRNNNLSPVLKVNNIIYGIGCELGKGSYGTVKWVENADGKRFALKSGETTFRQENAGSQIDNSPSVSTTKGSYKMHLNKVIRSDDKEISFSILKKVMFREAEVLQALNRGGQLVERIIDRERFRIQYNILMDFISGITVNQLIQEDTNSFPKSTYYQIALSIGEELNCLHQIGFFHGDLKPSNVIFNFETMQAKLIDFGSASKIGSNETRIWTKGISDPSSINRSTIQTEIYELGVTWALLLGFVKLKVDIITRLDWSDPPTDSTDLKLYNFIKQDMMNVQKTERPNLAAALDMIKSCILEKNPKDTSENEISTFTDPNLLFSIKSDCNNPQEVENEIKQQNTGSATPPRKNSLL